MAEPEDPKNTEAEMSEDDRRAEAAERNRKRALEQWEENKRRWRAMGVPDPLPAAGSTRKG